MLQYPAKGICRLSFFLPKGFGDGRPKVAEFQRYTRISTSTSTRSTHKKKKYAFSIPESSTAPPTDYYELSNNNSSNNIVWIPCAVKEWSSPLSLLTETLLPIYNLVRMFFEWPPPPQNDDKNKPKRRITILVTILNPDECDEACRKLLQMGLAWIGAQLLDIETFSLVNNLPTNSKAIICAKQGAAGMGMLTANGRSRGGHATKAFATSSNVGRGGLL
jgi:hypothetical protein